MLNDVIEYTGLTFRTSEEVYPQIIDACKKNPDIASYYELGESEEGRPILGIVLGNGLKTVSLIAGAHSDEPVGPETLRTFIIRGLEQKDILADLFKNYRFVIVPHINPDGEARNQAWINKWPDLSAYLQHAFRELPGRDLEFGFPDMRIENRLVSQFLERFSPFSL
ncbi:MAG: peptidase M14, partial [Aliifodinibius sp.]|nr:peptidase M14 [Fodinibius sp.]